MQSAEIPPVGLESLQHSNRRYTIIQLAVGKYIRSGNPRHPQGLTQISPKLDRRSCVLLLLLHTTYSKSRIEE